MHPYALHNKPIIFISNLKGRSQEQGRYSQNSRLTAWPFMHTAHKLFRPLTLLPPDGGELVEAPALLYSEMPATIMARPTASRDANGCAAAPTKSGSENAIACIGILMVVTANISVEPACFNNPVRNTFIKKFAARYAPRGRHASLQLSHVCCPAVSTVLHPG